MRIIASVAVFALLLQVIHAAQYANEPFQVLQASGAGDKSKGETILTNNGQAPTGTSCLGGCPVAAAQATQNIVLAEPFKSANNKTLKFPVIEPVKKLLCNCCGQATCGCCASGASCGCCGQTACACCNQTQHVAPEIRPEPVCCCVSQVPNCVMLASCACAARFKEELAATPADQGVTILAPTTPRQGDATKGETVLKPVSQSAAAPAPAPAAPAGNTSAPAPAAAPVPAAAPAPTPASNQTFVSAASNKTLTFAKVLNPAAACHASCCCQNNWASGCVQACGCCAEQHQAPEIRAEATCCCSNPVVGCRSDGACLNACSPQQHTKPELRDNYRKPCIRAEGCVRIVGSDDESLLEAQTETETETEAEAEVEAPCCCVTQVVGCRVADTCGCSNTVTTIQATLVPVTSPPSLVTPAKVPAGSLSPPPIAVVVSAVPTVTAACVAPSCNTQAPEIRPSTPTILTTACVAPACNTQAPEIRPEPTPVVVTTTPCGTVTTSPCAAATIAPAGVTVLSTPAGGDKTKGETVLTKL